MNLTPPWALPLIAPIGFAKSYAIAWLAWVTVLVLALWWSTRLLLDLYSGGRSIFPSEPRNREPLIAFTFYPAVWCLRFAQITPLVLAGVAGFLWFECRNRHVRAGMCLAMATIKPHLLYLVWLAMLFRLFRKRDWVAATSLASVLVLFTSMAILMRRTVLQDYGTLLRSGYTHLFPSALGAIVRYRFAKVDTFPLQFVAPLAGTIWFVCYWRRRRDDWQWKENMPLLVTISLLTTAYGWTFDQVLLLVPIVAVAARCAMAGEKLPRKLMILYTSMNIALFLLFSFWKDVAFAAAPLAIMAVLLKFTPHESRVRLAPVYGGSEP
ncbi:MAG TPA: glycosyltransferase family 87 protein [Candidatus Cybelea sp.]|nr:glycosyltransferase family 87 protein [Candidatus Cybelea sp.]